MAKADYQKRAARAVAAVLEGLGRGDDLEQLTQTLAGITDKNDLDVGEGLLRLAAEVLGLGGFTASAPLAYEGLRERYLPEIEFHGKVAHRNSQYALYAAAAIHGGVLPDLLSDAGWWGAELWQYALYALVAYTRAAAERRGTDLRQISRELEAVRGSSMTA